MMEEEKATTLLPETPGHAKLEKLDRRDKIVRGIELSILLLVVGLNIFLVLRLQQVINTNQRDTLEARQANVDRQNELKDYIKCILLIRYDHPIDELTTRQGVEAALDQCAQSKP